MATVSSLSTGDSSIFTMYGISGKGIGGLASGLDTDSLMEALTLGTRQKIANNQIQKQTLQWKQSAYQSVATTLNSFQESWFTTSSTTKNLKLNATFNSYKATVSSDKVSLISSSTSATGKVEIDRIDQLATNESYTINKNFNPDLTGTAIDLEALVGGDFDGEYLYLKVGNGTTKKIDLSSLDNIDPLATDPLYLDFEDEFTQKLQALINDAVGMDSPGVPKVEVTLGGTSGAYTINLDSSGSSGYTVMVANESEVLGFKANQLNYLNTSSADATLDSVFRLDPKEEYTFMVGTTEITVKGSDSVSSFIAKFMSSGSTARLTFDELTGQFTLTSTNSGAGRNIVLEDVEGDLISTIFGVEGTDYTRNEGKDAKITLSNGQTLTSATNEFNVNNIAFEVHSEHALGDGKITIDCSTDIDGLVDLITEFIDDYNTLVTALNAIINEESDKNYTALSDEQKAQMSESEITAYENEAKKGLLHNDSILRGILSDLRLAMSTNLESMGISLMDLGIFTKSTYSVSTTGSTSVDTSNPGYLIVQEDKLRAALAENPNGVRLLFTSSTTLQGEVGLAEAVENAILRATEESSTTDNNNNSTTTPKKTRGTLIRAAGTVKLKLTGDNTSELGDKIERIDEYIAKLKVRLENEYNRHWSRFTALETAIQKMNAQAGWLESFGS